MTTKKSKKIQKSKTIRIVEKIIRWLFYVELLVISLTLLSYLAEDATYGAEFVMLPPFSVLITILSIFIITKLRYTSNLVRIAIVLNWAVIALLVWNVVD